MSTQDGGRLGPPVLKRPLKGRHPRTVGHERVCAVSQEQFHHIGMTELGSLVERSPAVPQPSPSTVFSNPLPQWILDVLYSK